MSVFETMGTVASLTVPDGLTDELDRRVREVFAEHDSRFSLYRDDSEASLVSARTMPFGAASASYREAYWLAHDAMVETEGAFSPFRADGTVDLNGVVRALAMREAAKVLAFDTDGAIFATQGWRSSGFSRLLGLPNRDDPPPTGPSGASHEVGV
ncbi:hypothetical protein [Aestuariimicrobium ganziense]|uniref:hypothetical protein n=1 Tax=Aestuariimicrobium ganziense TaxID=2773677 RepID=UPI0019411921|nr:hypothetical protein [Aestuariimicrobium ganziense]